MKLLKSLLVFSRNITIASALFFSAPQVLVEGRPAHFSSVQCLTANLFFEARNQGTKGMQAVALVTYWRSKSATYSGDICKVVFQRKQFSWTHQQSYDTIVAVLEGDLSSFSKKDYQSYLQAERIAQTPFKEFLRVLPYQTMHYHSDKVKPKWLTDKVKVAKIGSHIFYKDK